MKQEEEKGNKHKSWANRNVGYPQEIIMAS